MTDDGYTALMISAERGHGSVVDALLKAGAAVNQVTTDDGWTALMMAAEKGHFNVCQLLLDAGADFSVQSTRQSGAHPEGSTAASVAHTAEIRTLVLGIAAT